MIERHSRKSVIDLTVLMFVFVGVCVFRAPHVLLRGRYWAEEGSLWWNHARNTGFFGHLKYVVPGNGYLSLNANLQTQIASWLPTRIGPLFTSWTSLLGMFLPAFVLFVIPRKIFRSRSEVIMIASLVLFASPVMEPDVFANSINLQTFLAISLAILILADWNKLSSRHVYFLVLPVQLLAILSGSYGLVTGMACLAIGFVRFTTHQKHEGGRSLDTSMIAFLVASLVAIVVQAGVFINGLLEHGVRPERARHPLPNVHNFLSFFASNLTTVFVSRSESDHLFERLTMDFGTALMWTVPFLILTASCVRPALRVRRLHGESWNFRAALLCSPSFAPVLLLVLYMLTAILTLYGYASPIPNTRYQVVASLVLLLCIVAAIDQNLQGAFRWVSLGLAIIAGLGVGITSFRDDPWTYLSCGRSCVSWEDQVIEAKQLVRTEYVFWPMHSDPRFTAPVLGVD